MKSKFDGTLSHAAAIHAAATRGGLKFSTIDKGKGGSVSVGGGEEGYDAPHRDHEPHRRHHARVSGGGHHQNHRS